jgi:hypothetical protein
MITHEARRAASSLPTNAGKRGQTRRALAPCRVRFGKAVILEHDLFRKPVSTFRDHALGDNGVALVPRHRP